MGNQEIAANGTHWGHTFSANMSIHMGFNSTYNSKPEYQIGKQCPHFK
jgi:hypothetical protein